LRYRLRYAEKGVRTSPADVRNKKPHLKGWQEKATTNPQQIVAESNVWPEAGILTPDLSTALPGVRTVRTVSDAVRRSGSYGGRMKVLG
jgi:bifunctional DNA primase/polymerase-like protein